VGSCGLLDTTSWTPGVTFRVPRSFLVDIIQHIGDLYDGDVAHFPLNSTIQWRVMTNRNGIAGLARSHLVTIGSIVDATTSVCNLTFNVAANHSVEVQNDLGRYRHGETLGLPNDISIIWRIYSPGGIWSGWNFYVVNNCANILDSNGALFDTNIAALADTLVEIRSHPGLLADGDRIKLPAWALVDWRVVGGLSIYGAWNSYTVWNGGWVNAVPAACTMTIRAPTGIGVEIALDDSIMYDGETIGLPRDSNITFRTRTNSSGNEGPWTPHSVGNCGVLDVTPSTCTMTLIVAPNSEVDIKNVAQNLVDGSTVILPRNGMFEWRVKTNMFYGSYVSSPVGNCGTLDASNAVCTLDIPTPAPADYVEIFGLPGRFYNGARLQLPVNRSIEYRVTASNITGPDIEHQVGNCAVPVDTGRSVCAMYITVPSNGDETEIYGVARLYRDGDPIDLPVNSTINWRARANGLVGEYYAHSVGNCAPLDTSTGFCTLSIVT
jgi:hypothetical protein